MRIASTGFPIWLLTGAGVAGLLLGLLGLLSLVPVAGVSPHLGFMARSAVLIVGLSGYPAIALLVSRLYDPAEVTRNGRVLAFVVVVAMAASLVLPATERRLRRAVDVRGEVPWPAVIGAMGAAAAVVVLLLI